ncbi:MAG: hypothetical protein HYV09_36710 [Deltaproteobacteria bacterium]|nr:hypothetical protein [Deltaproteobacteria bacterium]
MLSRRDVLRGAAIASGLVVLGCRSRRGAPTCTDVSTLSPEDAQTRVTLKYLDRAEDRSRACEVCTQFIEPQAEGSCGSCRVLKGPISPAGWCKVFAPKS